MYQKIEIILIETLDLRLICLGFSVYDYYEVAGSIPCTSINFKFLLSLGRGPPSLVRTFGQLLD